MKPKISLLLLLLLLQHKKCWHDPLLINESETLIGIDLRAPPIVTPWLALEDLAQHFPYIEEGEE